MDTGETRQSLETRMKITSKYLVDVRPPHYVLIPHLGITQGKPHLQPWNGEIKDGKAVGYKLNGLYGLQRTASQIEKKEEVKEDIKVEEISEKVLEKDTHSIAVDAKKNKEVKKTRTVGKTKSLKEMQKELSESFSKDI